MNTTPTTPTTARRRGPRFAVAAIAVSACSLLASTGADAAAGTPAKVRNGDQINCLLGGTSPCAGGVRFI